MIVEGDLWEMLARDPQPTVPIAAVRTELAVARPCHRGLRSALGPTGIRSASGQMSMFSSPASRASAEDLAGPGRSDLLRYRILSQEWPLWRLDEDRNAAFTYLSQILNGTAGARVPAISGSAAPANAPLARSPEALEVVQVFKRPGPPHLLRDP